MKNLKLIEFLSSIFGNYKEFSNGEFYYKCPFKDCSGSVKKKFAINLNSSDSSHYLHWHCWVCNNSGNSLFSLLRKTNANSSLVIKLKGILNYRDLNNINNVQSLIYNDKNSDKKLIELPKEFISLKHVSTNYEYLKVMKYLKSRNITMGDVVKYRMGYCDSGKFNGYIIIPSYDKNANLNYFVGRDYRDRTFRYKNPEIGKNVVFNELHINWKFRIILVEGIFDAIAIKKNAIPLLGKTINSEIRKKIYENNIHEICLCLDKDAIKQSIYYIEEFMRNGIDVYYIDLPGKDPSKLGFEKMYQLLKDAKKIEFEDLLRMKLNFLL